MTIGINDAVAQLQLTAIKDTFDGGTFEIRSGVRPANSNTAPSGGAVLATVPVGGGDATKSFTVSGRQLIAEGLPWTDLLADASGDATYAILKSADGTKRIDWSVGTSGTDLILTRTDLVAGEPFSITAASLTMPGA
jgi:hypothetical protein